MVSRFSIRNPYFIVVICLALMVIGVTSLTRMPVDLFPTINLPEVVVATFYSCRRKISRPISRNFASSSTLRGEESDEHQR
jgi:multidrug efflux pump subunit AcrB